MAATGDVTTARPDRAARVLLSLAAVAVAFAAADTYVVVLSLPDMMGSVGLSVDELQRAAPIVSGFLLGYVAMLPLIGRIADLRGRTPVLVAALVVFAFGSLVTAAAYDLGSLVTGRFLQGVGGGGLVPVTLALVADLYPADRRGVPLGIVGAVQELGSVIGPLYGAVVLSFGTWRDIFWINLAVGLVLAAAVVRLGRSPDSPRRSASRHAVRRMHNVSEYPFRRLDWIGLLLLALTLAGMLLVMRQPDGLVTSVAYGGPFVPFRPGGSIWLSQVGAATVVLAVLLVVRLLTAKRPLVDLRDWWGSVREADLIGAALLAIALAGVILAFATANPEVQVLSPAGPWWLGMGAVAAVLFVLHNRRSRAPLIPHGAFSDVAAWGAVLVSFFVGSALIAALVDIPIFARLTVADGSQIKAALVLVEFLVALPVGALVGGVLTRRMAAGAVAAIGMILAAIGFWLMSAWGLESLHHLSSSVVLVTAGFGFGLALAPVNAALLASTDDGVHGVASALLVVARMVGMLIGISALTTIGLRRYYAVEAGIPSPNEVCTGGRTRCAAYTRLIEQAGIEQLHAIFLGAAVCAVIAGAGARTTRPPNACPIAWCPRQTPRIGRSSGAPRPEGSPPVARCWARASFLPVGDFDDLLAANRDFAATFDSSGFDGVAHAGVAVVTCMDSRIVPLDMLGLHLGDAKIFRNPGGRVTPQALEALVLGVHLLRVERVLVVPHTRCAMASASLDELRARVSESAGQDASWQSFGVVEDQRAALEDDVRKVRAHPLIPASVAVGGFLYDVDTGLLDQLV